jgi:isoaspartyl peptidase/L-asparaginase-like protein (Ntn-hydrolase superfamily)
MHRCLHPVSVARRLMESAAHVMLAGDGADAFAEQQGFERANLIAPASRAKWLEWKRNGSRVDQSRDRGYETQRSRHDDMERPDPEEARWSGHDTIGALALDTHGVLAGACSTSGTPYKMPGRVGDSPIIGHGLYVDPAHGAVVATGEGELIMGVCSSFLVVESMRRGAAALEAITDALQRYSDAYELKDDHQVGLLALRPDGSFASGALRGGFKVSVTDRARSEVIEPDVVILG